MPRCASPGPGGHRCASQLSHPGPVHQEGDGLWGFYPAERTALAIVDRLGLVDDARVRTYAAILEQLNREEEAREQVGPPTSGPILARLLREEAARLGYPSVSDYLNDPHPRGQGVNVLGEQAKAEAEANRQRRAARAAAWFEGYQAGDADAYARVRWSAAGGNESDEPEPTRNPYAD